MKISCPHCGVSGSADDSYLGMKVKCPRCEGVFPVEEEETQLPPQESAESGDMDVLPGELTENESELGELPEVEEEISKETEDVEMPDQEESVEPPSGETLEDAAAKEEDVSLDWEDIQEDVEQELSELEISEADQGEEAPVEMSDEDETLEVAGIDDEDEAVLVIEEDIEEDVELLQEEAEAVVEALDDDGIVVEESLEEETVAVPEMESEQEPLETLESDLTAAEIDSDTVEEQPYGLDKEQCWQCGKEDSVGEPFIAKDGRLYCTDCLPPDEDATETAGFAAAAAAGAAGMGAASLGTEAHGGDADAADARMSVPPVPDGWTISGVIREAWARTKGAKGPIWAFSAIMYLVVLVVVAGTSVVTNILASMENLLLAEIGSTAIQFITDIVSVIFSAGLLYMGVKRAAGKRIYWRMGTKAFSCTGRIIAATVLQTIMLMIGFLLLIIPGIYLSVGYSMTLPLIVDRDMGPWEAMEASRKAVHKVWWRMFGLYLVVILIFIAAAIPLLLGLIWVWPLLFVLAGVVYRYFFGTKE